MSDSKLKVQKDVTAQVIIHIDEARVIMEDCKVFANPEGESEIIFQLQAPNSPSRTVQITLTKATPSEAVKKG